MRVTHLFAIAAAAGVVGLAAAPIAAAAPEQEFLDAIAGEGITWDPNNTSAVIDTGHAVCTDWDNGFTFSQEVAELVTATGWTLEQSGAFIGASTGAFCPQHMNKIG
ncbi:DUF732 domain-containing protein [Mycolicibacterium sp. S2-37]|uniref:DUF732 domain-containing protein n=1 Tax=Mycolicibacterium sp. S2-37 TaxID=2810297 RepID=UPI001A93BB87|nr:DUF732 domain-containing protein [Mycolicibacterium sp. S2-37]MBO0680159.1 DUF732 domain-containing protein [Mycolicibacterium sp. S2-37]